MVVMCARTTPSEQHHSPGAASLAASSFLLLWMARGKMFSDWRLIRLYQKECPDAVTRPQLNGHEIKTLHRVHSHTFTGTDLGALLRAHSLGHSCLAAASHTCVNAGTECVIPLSLTATLVQYASLTDGTQRG